MKRIKKLLFFMLLFCLLAVPVVHAAGNGEPPPPASKSIYDDLLPDEKDLKLDAPGVQKEYKKYAPENYGWDTELQIVELDGIIPKWNDPVSVTINSIAGALFSIAVSFMRVAIMLLQVGFSTNIVAPGIEKISGQIATVSENFYATFFGLASLFTMMFVIKHWAEGTRGQAVKTMLLAMLIPALMLGIAQKLPSVTGEVMDAVDAISILSMGATSIDGAVNEQATARTNGVKRLAESNNLLWLMLIDTPWTIGEFGNATPPAFTQKEMIELRSKGVEVSGNWKDAMLKYEVNHKDRQVLSGVLADEDIDHSSEIATQMLRSKGPFIRIGLASFALVNSILALVLCFLVMIGMLLSGVGFLLCLAAFAIFVLLSMIGDFGRNLVKKYGSITLYVVGFKIVISIFLSLLMIAFYLVEVCELNIFVNQFILAAILAAAIMIFFYLVKRGVAVSIRWAAQKMQAIKGEKPEQALQAIGKRRRKKIASPVDMDGKSISGTQPASTRGKGGKPRPPTPPTNPPAAPAVLPIARTGDGDVIPLEMARRNRKLSGMSLLQLQAERRGYEQRMASGESLTEAERMDMATIQQMERDRIRGRLSVADRRAIDNTWHEGRNLQAQRGEMMKLKKDNPSQYRSLGGDNQLAQMDKMIATNIQQEAQLLRPYMKVRDHHSPEEKQAREEMRKYYGDESIGIMQRHAHNDMVNSGEASASDAPVGGKTEVERTHEQASQNAAAAVLPTPQRQSSHRERENIKSNNPDMSRMPTQMERSTEKTVEASPFSQPTNVRNRGEESKVQRSTIDMQGRDMQILRDPDVRTKEVESNVGEGMVKESQQAAPSLMRSEQREKQENPMEAKRELSTEPWMHKEHKEEPHRERIDIEAASSAQSKPVTPKEKEEKNEPLTMDRWIAENKKKRQAERKDNIRPLARRTRVE
ncbi:hypothetical protein P4S91_04580 [Aneurinibacillus aneurinilyticus]|uniref:hypothetical protein n=1 Tax=Aneurinibacillus aneurinilyticus TaxID=1391 RepID=UPI002E1E4B90|nr:hypothetical protein [Aneurinibacillus aneurinilyticus]MED0722207.1 hypothetical protein [Aneurinibacillus aneurinilyticus]